MFLAGRRDRIAYPKYMLLVAKSRAACLSAVESYNRASSLYREETFAILMINAWELLLKARVTREHGSKASALHEYRQRTTRLPSKLLSSSHEKEQVSPLWSDWTMAIQPERGYPVGPRVKRAVGCSGNRPSGER